MNESLRLMNEPLTFMNESHINEYPNLEESSPSFVNFTLFNGSVKFSND